MPRPFQTPRTVVWGMGIRWYTLKVLRRCHSLSTALVVGSLWLCLITVINLGSNSQQYKPELKDEPNFSMRSDGFNSFLMLVGFTPTANKRPVSFSVLKLKPKLFPRNEIRESIASLQSAMKDRQTLNLTKNGIVRGRRIQEIKFSQTGGLETLSRKDTNDQGDIFLRNSRSNKVNRSSERTQINVKADDKAEIKQDSQAVTNNLVNFLPNWTQEHETRVFHFPPSDIPNSDLSKKPEESEINLIDPSRVKNPQSNSDSSDRKTRLEYSQMSAEIAEYRLPSQEKSMLEYFTQNIDKTRNRQNNFYASNRGTINTHFNEDKWNREHEKELRTIPSNSGAFSIANGYNSLNDSSTNFYDATNTKSPRDVRPKSNLQIPAGTRMKVLENYKDTPVHNPINQHKQRLRPIMGRDVKYPEDLSDSNQELNKAEIKLDVSASEPRNVEINIGDIHKHNGSQFYILDNKQDVSTIKNEKNTIAAVIDEQKQVSSNGTLNIQNNNLTNIGNEEITNQLKSTKFRHQDTPERMKYDGFELYAYNVTASNAIPLNRDIPDTRPLGCEHIPHSVSASLPKATIIICFHNEAPSVLLRTVTSVLNRTPAHLLEKIILVDDFSTYDNLTSILEEELRLAKNVFLTRTTKREGLVGARLLGAHLATSEVIVFLDAHCECNVGWLEPLLVSLSHNSKKVVSPYIDTIRSENFQYKQSPARLEGGFTWRLEFGWRAATDKNGQLQETLPINTPVISGGLFAVRRDYFMSIGAYDPQFNIWGGENFELSFKTWMCGGSVEIVPCSRVGHVFRASLPYTFSGDRRETVLKNLARVASVWMDEYADIFYAAVNFPNDLDIGDTSEREELRKQLKCHSFKWYLENIFPQMEIVTPNTVVYGQVRNKGSLMCFDVMSSAFGFYLGLSPCHGGKNQTLHLTTDKQLKQGDACIVPGINKQLMLSKCTSNVVWIYQGDHIILNHTNLCVTSVDNALVQLLPCEDPQSAIIHISSSSKSGSKATDTRHFINSNSLSSNDFQEWTFDYSFNWKRRRRRRT